MKICQSSVTPLNEPRTFSLKRNLTAVTRWHQDPAAAMIQAHSQPRNLPYGANFSSQQQFLIRLSTIFNWPWLTSILDVLAVMNEVSNIQKKNYVDIKGQER